MNFNEDWKVIVLRRWAGEFPPAGASTNDDDANVLLKSSEDIASDLSGFGTFTADEVSAFLAVSGYQIVFDEGYPRWKILAAETESKQLEDII